MVKINGFDFEERLSIVNANAVSEKAIWALKLALISSANSIKGTTDPLNTSLTWSKLVHEFSTRVHSNKVVISLHRTTLVEQQPILIYSFLSNHFHLSLIGTQI